MAENETRKTRRKGGKPTKNEGKENAKKLATEAHPTHQPTARGNKSGRSKIEKSQPKTTCQRLTREINTTIGKVDIFCGSKSTLEKFQRPDSSPAI